MISRALFMLLTFTFVAPATASEWMVVGAGNATCSHWNNGTPGQKTEILSWMAGFASAENLDRASKNVPEYHLEYLTYEYLRNQIDSACTISDKPKSMSSILFGVLSKLPVNSK